MIRGYPARTTLAPGADLLLHVSTTAARFRVDFYRYGTGMELIESSAWEEGCFRPDHLPFQDWGQDNVGLHGERLAAWPGYRFRIGEDWPPGVYIAVLVEPGSVPERRGGSVPERRGGSVPERHGGSVPPVPRADARMARALFVVRDDERRSRARILYKLPLLTFHAYNRVTATPGSWSLYTVPEPAQLATPVPPSVSVRRPGGGAGGWPWDAANFDPFDPTPRQTFVHWDARFVAWLERNGYAVDFCTDLDVHADAALELLGRYPLLLSAGHDEYWTDAMRANLARAVGAGHNVAFFGGNTCWWRVNFDDDDDDDCSFRRVAPWSEAGDGHEPENTLTGVSFRNGGERDTDEHPRPVGYRVQHADHWAFEGTGLADGATFGDRPDEYLVGYECDGALFDRRVLERGGAVSPTGEDGTPDDFVILGVGDLAASGWGMGNRAATMGTYERGGTVFNAATTDWARFLSDAPHPVVDRLTHNVVSRLSENTASPRRGRGPGR